MPRKKKDEILIEEMTAPESAPDNSEITDVAEAAETAEPDAPQEHGDAPELTHEPAETDSGDAESPDISGILDIAETPDIIANSDAPPNDDELTRECTDVEPGGDEGTDENPIAAEDTDSGDEKLPDDTGPDCDDHGEHAEALVTAPDTAAILEAPEILSIDEVADSGENMPEHADAVNIPEVADKPEPESMSESETPLPKRVRRVKTSEETPGTSPMETSPEAAAPTPKPRRQPRKKTIYELNLNDLDRELPDEERREWNAVYASYSAKSVLSGTVIGVDSTSFDVKNSATGETERKSLLSLIVVGHRVKILIPETELWAPGDERPQHVVRGMIGCRTDYIVMEIDREGECAVASRRLALAAQRKLFAKRAPKAGDKLTCNVVAVGAKRCSVELGGYDIQLTQRDLSYTAIPDLRERYRPGQELTCVLKSFDPSAGALSVSVKDATANPFIGADRRHPVGSRRHAVISGKYAGGVFCSLPDGSVCLCSYSVGHSDADFDDGDGVIILIRKYDYDRQLVFGKILAKW
ncbi:MAG: hypothetical protein LBL25_05040 [Oscillospiraceae bacterium]|jgi:hypothetical protein|nr:hypothetical protein [Oscillospiraceae bacterium]